MRGEEVRVRTASMLFTILLAYPAPAAAPTRPDAGRAPYGPAGAVAAMFEAFTRRSARDFTGWMTQDFRFTSADPSFAERFPNGMSREEEHAFASRLFGAAMKGGPSADSPHVLTIVLALGEIVTLGETAGSAQVVLERPHVRLAMSDGSQINLFGTPQAFELVAEGGGWRVRAWREGAAVPAGPLAIARPDTATRLKTPAPEFVLALDPLVDGRVGRLEFDVVLPRAGGRLDLYDLQGRRMDVRDLSDLPRGRHRIALDTHGKPPGMYWARLRQGDEWATAKVVWVR